jgi:hypothetical protein
LPAVSTAEPGFQAVCTYALKREGVKGKRAAVTLRAGRLGIVGEDGGAIWIDPADVERLRVCHDEGRYTEHFHADIVRTSRRDLLVLSPLASRDPNYSATIRALAAAIAERGGIGRIERGRSAFMAWLGPVLVGLLCVVGLGVGLFVLGHHVWWQRFAPAAALAILFGVLLWNAKTRLAPRPVQALGELDRQLP